MTTLAIAGWRIAIECSPTWVESRVRDAYGPFLVPDGDTASITLRVTVGPSAIPVDRDEGATTSEDILFDIPGVCGRIDAGLRKAALALKDEDYFGAIETCLSVYVRTLHCATVVCFFIAPGW